MRPGTILVLLGLVLLFTYFGWQAFGIIVLSVLGFLLLAALIVAWGLWRLKVRVKQTMETMAKDFDARLRAAGVPLDRTASDAAQDPARRDAIDVQGTVRKPRDGADDPDSLDAGPR